MDLKQAIKEASLVLIQELERRGFKEDVRPNGWQFRHREDGFTISFTAGGLFELITPDCETRGTAQQPSDILKLIDEAAAAL